MAFTVENEREDEDVLQTAGAPATGVSGGGGAPGGGGGGGGAPLHRQFVAFDKYFGTNAKAAGDTANRIGNELTTNLQTSTEKDVQAHKDATKKAFDNATYNPDGTYNWTPPDELKPSEATVNAFNTGKNATGSREGLQSMFAGPQSGWGARFNSALSWNAGADNFQDMNKNTFGDLDKYFERHRDDANAYLGRMRSLAEFEGVRRADTREAQGPQKVTVGGPLSDEHRRAIEALLAAEQEEQENAGYYDSDTGVYMGGMT